MGYIEGINDKPNEQGLNENTLEWRGRKLKDMQRKELIEALVNLFAANLALQEELKQYKRASGSGIITPYS